MIENHHCKNCREGTICQSVEDKYGIKWMCFKCGAKTE